MNAAYRSRHIGALLIEKAKELALENGFRGLYTQGRDNNLAACLFYIRRIYTENGDEGRMH